jgi:hypothetical protein
MPYSGAQNVACHAKASSCLNAGYQPSWACSDWFKQVWSFSGGKNVIYSGGYKDTCGGPLNPGEPTTTYQAKKTAKQMGIYDHVDGEKVYLLPTSK